jgi:glutamate/aspartate transport system substrate-binding protein
MRNSVHSVLLLAALLAASLAPDAMRAQSSNYELSPTLAQIKRTHTVRIGYRENAPPFSFVDSDGRPIGYSLELCNAIVGDIAAELDERELKRAYVKVTPDTRIRAVVQNQIDLECGSTTLNPDRDRQVAFSPLIYLSGTRLMVARASRINGIEDMAGKTVVVTRGTTNEAAVREAAAKLSLNLKIIVGDDHDQSFQMLADGKADAFATDEILLHGLIATHRAEDRFQVVGEYLSYESYGILYRRDERQLSTLIDRSFRTLAARRILQPLYDKWFTGRLPNGDQLNIPMSPQLAATFGKLAQPVPGGQ